MSRRPEGRRGRSRKSDPAEETATWLLEMEQQADSEREDEEDWAQQLRTTRASSGSTGQFPAVPVEGPAGTPLGQHSSGEAPPVHPPLAERYQSSASRTPPPAPQPAPTPTSDPAAPAWSWEPQAPSTGPWFGTQAGAHEARSRSDAWEPLAQAQQPLAPVDPQPSASPPWQVDDPGLVPPPPPEPQPWDTAAESEPWTGTWPLDESTQSWEVDDRSWLWPTQEAPSSTGSWELDPSSMRGDLWRTEPGEPGETAVPRPGEASGQVYGVPLRPGAASTGTGAPAEGYSAANGYPATGDVPAGGGYQTTGGYSSGGGYPVGGGTPATGGHGAEGFPVNGDLAGAGQFPAYGGTDPGFSTGPVGTDPAAMGAGSAYGFPAPPAASAAPPAASAAPMAPASPGAAAPWAGSSGATSVSGVGSVAAGPGLGDAAPALGAEAWADHSDSSWPEDRGSRSYGAASGEFASVLDEDEQVVRLGHAADPRGPGPADGGRAQATRGTRTAEARRVQPTGEHHAQRSSWPRVVALISWIVLLMVLCWFYVFPWLERILPENF